MKVPGDNQFPKKFEADSYYATHRNLKGTELDVFTETVENNSLESEINSSKWPEQNHLS